MAGFNRGGLPALLAHVRGPVIGADEIGADMAAVQYGYDLGATDDEMAYNVGSTYIEGVRRGGAPAMVANRIRAILQRALMQLDQGGGGGGGGGGRFRRQRVRGDDEIGADLDIDLGEDVLDGVDEMELGAIDEEISALEGDDDVVAGDSEEAIGATISQVSHRVDKLKELLVRLENKLAATPERKRAKRKRLMNRIINVQKKIAKKEATLRAKKEKALIKAGLSPAQAAAIAAGGAGAATAAAAAGLSLREINRAEAAVMQAQNQASQGVIGIGGLRFPAGQGSQQSIPFQLQSTGEVDPVFSKAAGGAGSTIVELETDSFSYADFIPLGVQIAVTVQGGDAADILPSILVTDWKIDGGLSQVYGSQSLPAFGGMASSMQAGPLTFSAFLPSLRQERIRLNRTNTAVLYVSLGNKLAHLGAINFKVEESLVVRVGIDDNLRG